MNAIEFKKANDLLNIENRTNVINCEILRLFGLNGCYNQKPINIDGLSKDETILKMAQRQYKKDAFYDRIKKLLNSKRVNEFKNAYKDKRSGYSMGEQVVIIFDDGEFGHTEVIADRCEKYRGTMNWNNKITYGKYQLIVDLSSARAKFSEQIKEKAL